MRHELTEHAGPAKHIHTAGQHHPVLRNIQTYTALVILRTTNELFTLLVMRYDLLRGAGRDIECAKEFGDSLMDEPFIVVANNGHGHRRKREFRVAFKGGVCQGWTDRNTPLGISEHEKAALVVMIGNHGSKKPGRLNIGMDLRIRVHGFLEPRLTFLR